MSLANASLLSYAVEQLHACARGTAVGCKICGVEATLFDVVDLAATCNKPRMPDGASSIPVYYFRCPACEFVFTTFFDDFTSEQWSSQIYNGAYYRDVDPDYAERRPHGNFAAVDTLLAGRHADWIGLDYGGGNGRTAELLRASGYKYETYDPFGHNDATAAMLGRYNFCSAFEVAEHSPHPHAMLSDIVSLCSRDSLAVLIGTHVSDGHVAANGRLDWWYASPRNGHVSLYSKRALNVLAAKFGLDTVSVSETSHLLTRGYSPGEARSFLLKGKVRNRLRRVFRR